MISRRLKLDIDPLFRRGAPQGHPIVRRHPAADKEPAPVVPTVGRAEVCAEHAVPTLPAEVIARDSSTEGGRLPLRAGRDAPRRHARAWRILLDLLPLTGAGVFPAKVPGFLHVLAIEDWDVAGVAADDEGRMDGACEEPCCHHSQV